MKLKSVIITLALAITANMSSIAQEGAYSTEDCAKYRSLYYEYLRQAMYKDATFFWAKAYTTCGGTDSLDGKFFNNGRVAYMQRLRDLDKVADSTEINNINDTIAWIYEQKLLIEKDADWALDYAVLLVSNDSKDYGKIDGLFDNIHTLKSKASGTHIRSYFRHLIINKFNAAEGDQKEVERTKVIEEYIVLSDYCAAAIKEAEGIEDAGDKDKQIKNYENAQDFIDKYFLKIAQDCSVLTPVLDSKFKTLGTGEDAMAQLNKFIGLMEKQGCTDTETYATYVTESVKRNPTAAGYAGLGTIQSKKGLKSEAVASFEKAVELEADGDNKNKYLYALAVSQYKKGDYKSAFSTGKKVEGDEKSDALQLCGDCIAATANGCGDSTFERKANYWLANDYYKRAGASSTKYLSNAPTTQEMFDQGISEGASINCSCWGESTTAR